MGRSSGRATQRVLLVGAALGAVMAGCASPGPDDAVARLAETTTPPPVVTSTVPATTNPPATTTTLPLPETDTETLVAALVRLDDLPDGWAADGPLAPGVTDPDLEACPGVAAPASRFADAVRSDVAVGYHADPLDGPFLAVRLVATDSAATAAAYAEALAELATACATFTVGDDRHELAGPGWPDGAAPPGNPVLVLESVFTGADASDPSAIRVHVAAPAGRHLAQLTWLTPGPTIDLATIATIADLTTTQLRNL